MKIPEIDSLQVLNNFYYGLLLQWSYFVVSVVNLLLHLTEMCLCVCGGDMVHMRMDMSMVSGTHWRLETYFPRIKEDYCKLRLKENTTDCTHSQQ